MQKVALYQSLLRELSRLPVEYLQQVEQFVAKLNMKNTGKDKNRQAILALAGSWSDLSEAEFEETRTAGKEAAT